MPINTNMILPELNKSFYQSPLVVAYGTNVALDLTTSNISTIVMTGNMTLDNIAVSASGFYYVYVTLDVTGGYAFTLGSNWNLLSGSFVNTANTVNILSFMTFQGQTKIQLFINQRP